MSADQVGLIWCHVESPISVLGALHQEACIVGLELGCPPAPLPITAPVGIFVSDAVRFAA